MGERSIKVRLEELEKDYNNNHVVTVPVKIFNQLDNSISCKFKVGMMELYVICIPNFTENRVCISSELFENTGLPNGIVTNIVVIDNKLCLGPVVAAFVSNGSIRKANDQNANFRLTELAKANKIANTILYFFSIKDVDFIHARIYGTYFNNEKGEWGKNPFPFPDVLYDRGGGTLKKQRVMSKYIRKQFEEYTNIKKVNSQYFFDKWDTYRKLAENEEVKRYLPLSTIYKEPYDLINMFQYSSSIYMKYCYGSNGRSIMRIDKLSDNTFCYSYFNEGLVKRKVQSLEELIKQVNTFFNGKKTLVQSAIDVIKVGNRNVDLRATLQRNGSGELTLSACPVRLGREYFPITSTKSGSSVYKFEEFFKEYFQLSNLEINDLKEWIFVFLYKVYKSIEESYGEFGELGIDFALDNNWDIWFIECNAKPGKDTLYQSYGRDTITKAFLNPLEYSKYICGFNN